jgi:single-strand DNA-binding protein
MSGLISCVVVGNVGGDPELRYTKNGKAVVSFSLAVNKSWKDKDGEWQTVTTWFKVTAWDRLAERIAENIQKGDVVTVDVKNISADAWLDAETGEVRSKVVLTARTVYSHRKKKKNDDGETSVEETADLPF